jgi:2-dehydro-3-deoxyphosphogluconate aldolase/(4S)-4-hydroxy-2-oxoglutarate aldolase
MNDFLELLARDRALPLHVPCSADDAAGAVRRAQEAGLGLLEVALRTPEAEDALASVATGPVLVGAGTVLDVAQVERVVGLGAAFVVTPGFHRPVVERCLELGVPVLPGAATPGEVMAALALGLTTLKLFPARELGGPAYVRALAGPFPHVRLVPSGGVTREDAGDYLALDAVVAVSGSWVLS